MRLEGRTVALQKHYTTVIFGSWIHYKDSNLVTSTVFMAIVVTTIFFELFDSRRTLGPFTHAVDGWN